MSEFLDHVDENDNVIGQLPREEIHAKNLGRRVVQVFVVNDKQEILAQWRGAHKPGSPRMFDAAVGGHLDVGECYDDAAVREMQEELGIETELEFITKFANKEWNEFVQLYLTTHEGPFEGWQTEADALEWFSFDELEHLMQRLPYLFTEAFKNSLKAYKTYLGGQN